MKLGSFLKKIDCCCYRTVQSWSLTIAEESDPLVILRDNRGGKLRESFYDMYPDLENEARTYSIINCSKKNSLFTTQTLATFITKRYSELTGVIFEEGQLIRSLSSCRYDLHRWGAKYTKNKKRPYFEGHEREDVVASRKCYIDWFQSIKNNVYQQCKDPVDWIEPSDDPVYIILSHDESTFKSGECQTSKWMFDEYASFYNKGQCKSLMLSYFLVQHKFIELFELEESEWNEAVEAFPHLLEKDPVANYEPRSANAWVEPGKDNYFNNEVIIKQFERLFILFKFKTIFKNHKMVVIVDNARTHSAKKYDINKMNKAKDTSCPYDTLEWTEENGEIKSINCFNNDGTSKGLFVICKELGLIERLTELKHIKLDKLRQIAATHPIFSNESNLELLAKKHNVIIKFCPKFHCELNPIESLWCFMKQYVRKRTDQTFNKMKLLMEQSVDQFKEKNINIKLWRRMWQGLNMYNDPTLSYKDIIIMLYGARTSENISKRVIYSY